MDEPKSNQEQEQRIPVADDAAGFLENESSKQLFHLHWHELCNFLRSKYEGASLDVEDIAQTAFTKMELLDNPETIENPKAFLFTTARNLAVDEIRKVKIRLAYQQDSQNECVDEKMTNFRPKTS